MLGLSEVFIRVLCIASVLLYSASISLIGNPKVEAPSELIFKVIRFSKSQAKVFVPETAEEAFRYRSLASRISNLQGLTREFGRFVQPPTLIIDFDHPLRYAVEATEITIGSSILKAKNQLERALLKSWILQKASSTTIIDTLKIEVAADIMLSGFLGGFALEEPHLKKMAHIDLNQEWTEQLLNINELCKTAWRPLELISYCTGLESQALSAVDSPYLLRQVVTHLIWKDLSQQSAFQRWNSLKQIVQQIQLQNINSLDPTQEPSSPNQSLASLKKKIESVSSQIYPQLKSTLSENKPQVAILRDSKFYLLGGTEIAKSDTQLEKVIVESCVVPSVKELLQRTTEQTTHILLVEKCDSVLEDFPKGLQSSRGDLLRAGHISSPVSGQGVLLAQQRSNNILPVSYKRFLVTGAIGFASENPQANFILLHRPSLKLASKMINNFELAHVLRHDPASRNARFLGLDQKSYSPNLRAFKVDGPIGAIEWFRAQLPTESESRS